MIACPTQTKQERHSMVSLDENNKKGLPSPPLTKIRPSSEYVSLCRRRRRRGSTRCIITVVIQLYILTTILALLSSHQNTSNSGLVVGAFPPRLPLSFKKTTMMTIKRIPLWRQNNNNNMATIFKSFRQRQQQQQQQRTMGGMTTMMGIVGRRQGRTFTFHSDNIISRRSSAMTTFGGSFRGGGSSYHPPPTTLRHYATAKDADTKKNPTTLPDDDDNSLETSPSQQQQQQHSLYESLVRRLYMTNLFHPVKLGLDNIERLYDALDRPLDNIPVIHIAGTNGKGSVSYKIAQTLRSSTTTSPSSSHHLTIGLFTSPHISCFRERLSINSQIATEDDIATLLPRINEICQSQNIPATFFEITTALAFLFFADKKSDAVVLETGLGGRLDATNVLRKPILTIITNIGLEHTRILGDTVEQIAREKAGIMKRGVTCLVGAMDVSVLEVMRECALERGVKRLVTVGEVLGESEEEEGDYDVVNSRLARAALLLLKEEEEERQKGEVKGTALLCEGLTEESLSMGTSVRPPCRFELVTVNVPNKDESAIDDVTLISKLNTTLPTTTGNDDDDDDDSSVVNVILDVAHNPSAIDHLLSKLQRTFGAEDKFRFVVGFSRDKDLSHCLSSLLTATGGDASRIHLVKARHPRAATLDMMLMASPEVLREGARYDRRGTTNADDDEEEEEGEGSIAMQIYEALQLAKDDKNEIVVVCGSVFIMSEAREALGYEEPRDSDYIAAMAGVNLKHGQEHFVDDDDDDLKDDNEMVMTTTTTILNNKVDDAKT